MKNMIRYISGIMLSGALILGVVACSPDNVPSVNEAGIPTVAEYEDAINVWVDQETNYAHFEFTGAKGVYPVWIVDGKSYSSGHQVKKYYRKAGDYTVEIKMGNANGMSDGTLTRTFHIDKTRLSGFPGFVYDGPYNLWKTATVESPEFFYATTGDWVILPAPNYSFDGNAYSVNWTQGTVAQWQAQMMLNTNIALQAGKSYDGSVILTSSKDHPSVTWKICEVGNDANALYDNQKISLKAGEPVSIWFSNLLCKSNNAAVKIVFDFGKNAENTEIIVENLVIKDHANDDGTEVPKVDETPEPTWVAVDSNDNLWNGATFTNSFFYADAGWAPRPDPLMVVNGRSYTLTFPLSTAERWQNQFVFLTNLSDDTKTVYDFRVVMKASEDLKGATVKLVHSGEGNDGNFFFDQKIDLTADTEAVCWKASVKAPKPMDAISLVFDFGGNPANTTVTVKDIILQKHRD